MTFMRRSGIYIALLGLLGLLFGAANAEAQDAQTICLDPGHQLYGNNGLEPVAPDSREMKAKVSSGTRGVRTKKPEYVLNLEASLLMKEKLETLGYKVIMTRDTHEVDLSNIERARMCNQAHADLAVRIHADGDASPKTNGISLLYPAQSERSQPIYAGSKEAAQLVLKEAVNAAGAASRGVIARADLSGFNWSEVPTILVEMGFMTNPEEDEKLSDSDYLDRLAQGVVNGINIFMAEQVQGAESEEAARIYLPGDTRLYELSHGRMMRTSLTLSTQTVETSAVWGAWSKVNTWVGDRWVYTGQGPIEVKATDMRIELLKDTPMYGSPLAGGPIGTLTPQKVHAYEQWNDWYLIDTWLGKLWIRQ